MDDFNSSDVEMEPPPPNPHAHYGSKSIEAMLATSYEDRLKTKKRMANLQNTSGAPGTVYLRFLWMNRFEAYMTLARGMSAQHVPTGEDVARFLETVSTKIKPKDVRGRDNKPVPSLSTMRRATVAIFDGLSFKHGLKPSRQELKRIDTVLDSLVKEGALAPGLWRKRQQVGHMLLRRIGRAWFIDSLTNGCLSWDVIISKFLPIALMSASASRAGDVVRSKQYTGLECLRWEHIDLVLEGDGEPSVGSMVARITLAYEKGYKDKPNVDKVVTIKALGDVADNVMCPIKLLLIQALRTGHVEHVSIRSLLLSVSSTPGRRVQWRNASDPVVPKIKTKGTFLDFSAPAGVNQVLDTMGQAGLKAGVLEQLHTHDVRGGAGRDISKLPPDLIKGVASPAVAKALGHSHKTLSSGITDRYVGGIDTALNELVATHAQPDRFGPRVTTTGQGYSKKTNFSGQTITKFCNDTGLDPAVTKDRDVARQRLKKKEELRWIQQQRDVLSAPEPGPRPGGPSSGLKRKISTATTASTTTSNPLAERSPNVAAPAPPSKKRKTARPRQDNTTGPYALIDPQLLGGDAATVMTAAEDDEAENEEYGDPDETLDPSSSSSSPFDHAQASGLVESLVFGGPGTVTAHDAGTEESRRLDALAEDQVIGELFDEALTAEAHGSAPSSAAETTPTSALSLPGDQFVDHFARINIVRNYSSNETSDLADAEARLLPQLVATGNSRDMPTCFQIPCPAAHIGCKFTHHDPRRVKVHRSSQLCIANNPAAPIDGRPADERPHICEEDGCGRAYKSKKGLQGHIKSIHQWVPKVCGLPDCPEPQVLWETYSKFTIHRTNGHDPEFAPTTCQVPGCDSTIRYNTRVLYAGHLTVVHQLNSTQRKEYIKPKASITTGRPRNLPEFTPRKCPLGGCRSKTTFDRRDSLQQHLDLRHKIDRKSDEMRKLVE